MLTVTRLTVLLASGGTKGQQGQLEHAACASSSTEASSSRLLCTPTRHRRRSIPREHVSILKNLFPRARPSSRFSTHINVPNGDTYCTRSRFIAGWAGVEATHCEAACTLAQPAADTDVLAVAHHHARQQPTLHLAVGLPTGAIVGVIRHAYSQVVVGMHHKCRAAHEVKPSDHYLAVATLPLAVLVDLTGQRTVTNG
eukprot:COSAG02_NODE_653_length_18827_cov_44.237826_3_plen_198_part_00